MRQPTLNKDPFSLIISGVGGQGNVLMSGFVGEALVNEGFLVSVADTFGVTQRGGSVTSHIKISKKTLYTSITLEGKADVILGMEPIEAMRSLGEFGNPNVVLIVNSRPVYPYGNVAYPDLNQVKKLITKFSSNSKFVNATEEALKMGSPIYTNIILLGSLVGAEVLPVQKETMINVLKGNFPDKLIEINIQAFNKGMEIITAA